ncbi:hypothetical protein Cgig2_001091 [Carnegiea gigantea]|uniref:Solute carrier family 35 member F1 n=1 Tax=Carnegiea gigantea TaxID=171969 RepID=A0A9Q1JV39_9CARY|nr:hypothetical protein Cgig2_001091 [Carnegiea gigantea]
MGSSGSGGCGGWLNKNEALLRTLFVLFLGVDAPIAQSFFNYFCLTAVYGGIMLFRRKKLLAPWYYYLPLGFVDVQGNYLVVKAFQYTSITSVTLLDCWTIPWVIILTWAVLGTRYSIWQYVGAATCIIGLCLVLLSDSGVSGGGGSNPLLGDFLVIAGTLFYALSNVGEEFFVKQKDLVETISMLGVFGLLFSLCEMYPFVANKRSKLEAIEWSTNVVLGFGGFAAASFLFYTLVPFVLRLSGATLFNLSILTSDMWAVAIRILFYRQRVDWLYYISFAFVVVGLIIYSQSENSPVPMASGLGGHPGGEYQVLDEESAESRAETLIHRILRRTKLNGFESLTYKD